MNFEFFIAKRIIGSKSYKSSVSSPIIKIGIAAISIGMIVMLVAISTGLGLQHEIRNKVVAFNGHVTISNFDNNTSNESESPITPAPNFYKSLSALGGIAHIQPIVTKFGVIRTETDFEGVVVKGVNHLYNWSYFKDFLVEGRLPDYSGSQSQEVLVSKYLANRLQFKVGDTFPAYFSSGSVEKPPRILPYTIVGIYESGFQDLDKLYVIGDIRHLQRLNKWSRDQAGHFEVFLDDFSQLKDKGLEIYNTIPSILNAITIEEKYEDLFKWFKVFYNNTYGIIFIIIIVAGFNMITALLVLILERTQMVGILKSLGCSNWGIRKIFLYNVTYLIALGLFWGNLIGLALLYFQKKLKLLEFPNPEQYYATTIPVYISLDYVILLNVGTFFVCLILLLIPSYIITKISPVSAIRFQ